tara:strand:+ start:149 stop:568 length:420 start_codon:yes stop_codon:yes gene_type:complete
MRVVPTQMPWPDKASVTWQEQVRTMSAVVSAICLLTMTVAMVSAGVYTVNVVSNIEHHHGYLTSVMKNSKETLSSAHDLLQSDRMTPLMDDFHNLVGVMSALATSLDQLRVQEVLQEAENWRNMSNHAMVKLAKTILEN